ncbi:MAG: S-layer homology domain-containing protein [Firmicutes bacterium]|nr:S-layer homology domain-containing protein [Bacillota bacterium]
MKRKLTALAISLMLLSQTAYCRPDPETGFDVENGTLISYVGTDRMILVPAEQNGEKVTDIGEKAMAETIVENIDIESGIKNIGKLAFSKSTVYSVTLSDTLENVGEGAFYDCPNLANMTLVNPKVHFEKDALKETYYIVFWIDCKTSPEDEETLAKNIYEAKGDDNFEIAYLHDYDFNDDIEAYVCKNCGNIQAIEDGRDPDEIMNGAPSAHEIFEDVEPNAWYAHYVDYAVQAGIINGKSETIFAPDDNITVAEAVKLAACAHAQSRGTAYIPEVKSEENWYDKYLYYATENGIVGTDFDFEASRPATRAEVAYLFSGADVSEYFLNEVPITDIPDVDENTLYHDKILKMYDLGAAVGDENMTFRPDDNIKRSEAAAMIIRVIDTSYRIELPKG